jgi:hypothetical protein
MRYCFSMFFFCFFYFSELLSCFFSSLSVHMNLIRCLIGHVAIERKGQGKDGGGGPLKLVVGILQRDEPLILFIAESRRKIQGPTSTPFRSFSDE